jgi:hypothetical protein
MTRGLYPIRLLARLISSPLPFSTPLHIFRLVSCRVRLAARITHVVHPDRTVEFNVVDLDLLADGVYLEDVHSTNGEWGEVEAPAPKHLGAEVENVHGVNAGHGGYIWQTLDEFFFGIGRAELWEKRKGQWQVCRNWELGVSSDILRHWSTSQRSASGLRNHLQECGWRELSSRAW